MPETQNYPDLTAPRADQSAPIPASDPRSLFAALRARYAQSPAFAKSQAEWDALEKALASAGVSAARRANAPDTPAELVGVAVKAKLLDAARVVPVDDFVSPYGKGQIEMRNRMIAALEKVQV